MVFLVVFQANIAKFIIMEGSCLLIHEFFLAHQSGDHIEWIFTTNEAQSVFIDFIGNKEEKLETVGPTFHVGNHFHPGQLKT